MDDFDFELVDNEKRHLSRHSLARLKALAPTFSERSRERLACVELIAEREQALAQVAVKVAARRSMWALAALRAKFLSAPILRPAPALSARRGKIPASRSITPPPATPVVQKAQAGT